MAAPVIASSSVDKTGNTLTDLTFTYGADGPSGIAAGNLLLLIGTCVKATTAATLSAALFTPIRHVQAAAGTNRGTVGAWWKTAGAAETTQNLLSDGNVATDGFVGKMYRITGQHPTTPINASNEIDTATDNAAIPGVTTTVNECLVFYISGTGSGSTNTWTWDAGVTEDADFGTDPGLSANMTIATKVQAVAGATGNIISTPSGGIANKEGICIAIAPVSVVERTFAGGAGAQAITGIGEITVPGVVG